MMRRVMLLALLVAVPSIGFGQQVPTNESKFTLDSKALGLSGGGTTVAATDIGVTFALTKNLSVRSDNILIGDNGNSGPSGPTQMFLAGVQYHLPSDWLIKHTWIDPQKFQLYAVAQLGVSRATDSNQLAGSAGGGANYDPTGSGKFLINLFEVRWVAKAPVGAKTNVSNAVMFATGFKVSF
jgi:hypothetical protein